MNAPTYPRCAWEEALAFSHDSPPEGDLPNEDDHWLEHEAGDFFRFTFHHWRRPSALQSCTVRAWDSRLAWLTFEAVYPPRRFTATTIHHTPGPLL